MSVRQVLSLALVAAICSFAGAEQNQCYQCGYQQEDGGDGYGPPMALPGLPECKDHASQQDNKVECEGEDDCCGSIREFLEIEDTETGEHRSLVIGRHDCETALASYAKYGVLCSEHTDECVDVALDGLPEGHNETIMRAKVCFCSGPLCNWHVPGLDTTLEPEPTKEPTNPTQKGKQCYNCGHRTLPDGTTEALPDLPECGDFATPDDITTTCGNGDDCCASVEASFTTEDETTGEKSTVIIGRHGCESDLSHIGEVGVLCSEHTDECLNVEHSSLPNIQDHNVTITDMEICFCSGDRCNVEDPTIPPEPTNEPTQPTQKGKQCYNCGYRKLPNGETEALPDTAECSDFASPEDITVNCANGDDCCASMKEYYTTIDETTGENSTIIIGRHGCESDLNHIGEQTVLCSEHTDSCLNIDRSSLPDQQDHNVTVTDIEICFCSGDRCNAEDPIPPLPTTPAPTTQGSGVANLVSSLSVLILAFFC